MYDEARRHVSRVREGPCAGVPFLLKDLGAEYARVPLADGSRFLAGRCVSPVDSELVARYKRAGLVVVGKSNTPELGIVPTTEPRLSGPARNPWDLNRTPGGSSGGWAAAWPPGWARRTGRPATPVEFEPLTWASSRSDGGAPPPTFC